jgi:glucose-1-phosphate adenylyltransferase
MPFSKTLMRAVSVILGGGQGTRLLPLTAERSKPAVPIAGKYRLVDIPISNCINSGIRQIYVLTQFNSESLHRHIQRAYRFDTFSHGYVRILAAQQTPSSESWFQGTADAVRQSARHFMEEDADLVVILSGDQLYRMNFQDVIRQHLETKADLTICTKPVERRDAGSLGIMQVDDSKRIVKFVEKPGQTAALDALKAPMYKEERYLASMGIYVFNKDVLRKVLDNNLTDFGKHVIPASIITQKVYSYVFEGYWRDIGTIRSFWETNVALTEAKPEFNFYDPRAPIYTDMRHLPPSKINGCDLNQCLLSEGCIISGDRILHSVIGIRASIGEGTVIEHSYVMGADFYEHFVDDPTLPRVGIGRGCFIKNAIIDKNACIGDGSCLSPEGKPRDVTEKLYAIHDGILVIPKGAVIPAGTRI